MTRILIAADKFKTTLSSREVAQAIAKGVFQVSPTCEVTSYVVSDGGEGFLDAVSQTIALERRPLTVSGPLGRPVSAELGITADASEIFIESSQANGYHLIVDPAERHPLRTTSAGVGELIRAALERRPRALHVGLGSSATIDAGLPAARALGYSFLDAAGAPLAASARALELIEHLVPPAPHPVPEGTQVYGVVDVDNPPTGPEGGVRVYGPQKGADPETLARLESGVDRLLDLLRRETGHDHSALVGGGAAGCLGLGLVAFCRAQLRSGSAFVIDTLGLRQLVEEHDVLVTGEGSFDTQSLYGKIPGALLQLAREHGKPAFLVTGRRAVPDEAHGLTRACYSVEQAIADGAVPGIEASAAALTRHGAALARRLTEDR